MTHLKAPPLPKNLFDFSNLDDVPEQVSGVNADKQKLNRDMKISRHPIMKLLHMARPAGLTAREIAISLYRLTGEEWSDSTISSYLSFSYAKLRVKRSKDAGHPYRYFINI